MSEPAIDSPPGNKYYVPALEKGLDILEVLAHCSQAISLTELAHRLDRSASELFRLLVALEARGYISKDSSTGMYSLSLKLYELAHLHPPELNLLEASAVPMEDFARRTHESCHISIFRAGMVIVLKEALTSDPIRLSASTGGQFSALHTTSGRLLLAYLMPDRLTAFLSANEEFAAMGEAEQLTFRARLDEIRTAGVSWSENENHIGVRDAAVAVGNPKIGLVAALACTWLTAVMQPAQTSTILEELQRSAEEITSALGLSHE
jgi:DNA-binding IclR family transcriptional regulator